MLKLKALQEKKKKEAAAAAAAAASNDTTGGATSSSTEKKDNVFSLSKGTGGKKNRQNAAVLRIQGELSEWTDVPGCKLEIPDPNNLMHFLTHIVPGEGPYKGAEFVFDVTIPPSYPYSAPKVVCITQIYHPNISFERGQDGTGAVCLNVLREDWMPVLSLNAVVFGLLSLMLQPNPDDPLDKEAAKQMAERPQEFERTVARTLRGGYHFGRHFPKLLK